MKFIFAYLLMVVFVNLGFSYLPIVPTPLGAVPLMAFFVGCVFVLRDYAQRSAGHHVLWAIALACLISYWLGDPVVVVASVTSFAVSELLDYAIFTITKKPFHERVVFSSMIAVPVDSFIFLHMIGYASWGSILAMSLSKFFASALLYVIYENRKRNGLTVA
jgi:uncharacterized PurR-regulated membrane protein YhhQ (DUF165 family)